MDGLYWTSRRHWWERLDNTVTEFHLSETSGLCGAWTWTELAWQIEMLTTLLFPAPSSIQLTCPLSSLTCPLPSGCPWSPISRFQVSLSLTSGTFDFFWASHSSTPSQCPSLFWGSYLYSMLLKRNNLQIRYQKNMTEYFCILTFV